ncbi:hypothetical protein ABZW03_16675 [Kitasatospora sp. NPDC004799]|uniref:hypothetical protein n=1 Tax=Kitasatospora sp. NPDC004799 TaxID=3154460 RepID=UPI0033B5F555
MSTPSTTPLPRRLAACAVPGTLVFVLTACGAVTDAAQPRASASLVSPEQAVQRLDALLEDSLSQVQPRPRYWDAWPRSTEQTGGTEDGSPGYATATRDRYIMTKVAPAKYDALIDMVGQGWKAKGYTVAAPAGSALPSLTARTPDGSSVTITVFEFGNIDISATVPRIPVIRDHDPFGTPTPDPVMANGNLDVLPRYDDPFWSS